MEGRGLKIIRKKTECFCCNEWTSIRRDAFIRRDGKYSEDIEIYGIAIGGLLITGCRNQPQSAKRVEELVKSV